MIDLSQTTFIIPVRIESPDREFNFKYVIQYLCDNLETNIIIKESDHTSKCYELLQSIEKHNTDITYMFEQDVNPIFHRTRILNEMLFKVKTPVVVNYDIDVFIEPKFYLEAQNLILSGYDLVYPYFEGMSQKAIIETGNQKLLTNQPLVENIDYVIKPSICGHCQFFNTKSYREGCMENEELVGWCGEDTERMERFQKLGYKVMWMQNNIFHIEHGRGMNSGRMHQNYVFNQNQIEHLSNMTSEKIMAYYQGREYLKKYR